MTVKVIFICTANSCRSQMAETWARHLFPDDWNVASAGLLTYPISRRTEAVMQEVGLSTAGQHSQSIDEYDLDAFDLVVTLSDEAGNYLPALRDPSRHWHRPFADPMAAVGTPTDVREAFREGRQQARRIVQEVIAAFGGGAPV
jgi:arsenate reductase (thioredoxin)